MPESQVLSGRRWHLACCESSAVQWHWILPAEEPGHRHALAAALEGRFEVRPSHQQVPRRWQLVSARIAPCSERSDAIADVDARNRALRELYSRGWELSIWVCGYGSVPTLEPRDSMSFLSSKRSTAHPVMRRVPTTRVGINYSGASGEVCTFSGSHLREASQKQSLHKLMF